MKFYTVAAVLLVSLFASSMALPARLSYYQQPSFYYQSQSSPQRLMYLQYVQQPSSSKTSSRLTNSAAAFITGETVATGTYLKDDASVEQQIAAESILDNTGANGAQSIAEAYPAELEDPQDDEDLDAAIAGAAEIAKAEIPEVQEAAELPVDNQVLEDEIAPVAEELPSEDDDETPAEADPEPAIANAVAPEVPEISEPSAVEVQEDAENDDDDEDEANVPIIPRRRPAGKATPAPLPVGNFFPIDFGGTTGGATAIANSFSTGVSGSAKSQAIAYGKPEPSITKLRPSRRH